ncbi:hypothetical protein [Sandaracinus amylolyticus]|uniref:Uncharacterized protein n=1 Tax=Sandaracinus amylolyticus TaxID=927083 RepID=A0A0F6W4C8_9BACT|nr:hypothetical protein [Sandaracinus amylolyticus]AKF07098.1 hypothetical protein DB32_004247 [Sandaracinus amylolyticus]
MEAWIATRELPDAAWIALALCALEMLALMLPRRWIARLAFLPLTAERIVRVPPEVRVVDVRAGYRSAAVRVARGLPARVAIADTVLATSTTRRGRSFCWGERRRAWPVRVDLAWEDDGVHLRARMLPVPLVTPLVLAVSIAEVTLRASSSLPAIALLAAAVSALAWIAQRAEPRPTAIERAYDAVERALTRPAPAVRDVSSCAR